jgi:uncharacterized protein
VKSLTIGEVRAEPGTKAHGLLPVAEHPDGSTENLPYVIANGLAEGPTVWITGCEHGEESLAAAAIIEFMSGLDPRKLRGSVVGFPVLNSTAFNVKQRYSPIDSFDFSRAYPGFENGWLAQQVAHQILGLIADNADYVVNVHNGIPGMLEVSPYCIAHYQKESEWESTLKGFTESFLIDKIVHWYGTSSEKGARTSTLSAAVEKKGIPIFVPEIGPDNRGGLRLGIHGLRNTLRFLKMVSGNPTRLAKYYSFPDMVHLFPIHGGVFTSYVDLNDTVKTGQKLCSIRSFTGEITEEMIAPADGVILDVWSNPVIGTGDFFAFGIATFEPFKTPWP